MQGYTISRQSNNVTIFTDSLIVKKSVCRLIAKISIYGDFQSHKDTWPTRKSCIYSRFRDDTQLNIPI